MKFWAELLHEARSIPAAERKELLPRKAKEGTFDISTARLFWDRPRLQQRLFSALQTHFPTIVCNGVCMYVLVAVFLRDFGALQKLWRKKEPLTDVEVASAKTLCQSIGTCWQALGWKPTPRVHWTVAHSHYFLAKYRTLYLFSSVPAEHRHRRFKVTGEKLHAWMVAAKAPCVKTGLAPCPQHGDHANWLASLCGTQGSCIFETTTPLIGKDVVLNKSIHIECVCAPNPCCCEVGVCAGRGGSGAGIPAGTPAGTPFQRWKGALEGGSSGGSNARRGPKKSLEAR